MPSSSNGLRWVIGGSLLLFGSMCIGIAYNNNGSLLFASWGNLYRAIVAGQKLSAADAAKSAAMGAVTGASKQQQTKQSAGIAHAGKVAAAGAVSGARG